MLTVLVVIAAVAVLMLAGQFFAGTADFYLAVQNPRPLDENLTLITSSWWGFVSRTSGDPIEDLSGQGFADVRIFATRPQVLASIFSFGFVRQVSVSWRGNAGQHPLGDA